MSAASERDRTWLTAALLALTAAYGGWLWAEGAEPGLWAVFALPPLLLGAGVWLRRRTAPFWSGVMALLWFSHGVMVAYSEPDQRTWGLAVTALSVAIVVLSSLRGLVARFSRGG